MDAFLRDNKQLNKVVRALRASRLPEYADQVIKLAQQNLFYLDKFSRKDELAHIVAEDQTREELSTLLREQDYAENILSLRQYSRFVLLRSVIRLVNEEHPTNISLEYNQFSDLLMLEADRLIKETIGDAPTNYAVVRLGSKGRTGSDLFSDLDVAFVYDEDISVEDSMYFELYASKFVKLMARLEYQVDVPIRPESPEKKELKKIKEKRREGMYNGHGRFSLQNQFGFLTGSLSDYFFYYDKGIADIVEKTAILDIFPVIESQVIDNLDTLPSSASDPIVLSGQIPPRSIRDVEISRIGFSRYLIEAVQASLLEGPNRETYQHELIEDFGNFKTRTEKRRAEGLGPDVKFGYGGLLTLTRFGAFLKTTLGEYHTHPSVLYNAAENEGLITREDIDTITSSSLFLRQVRNWVHLREMTLDDYLKGGQQNVVQDYTAISPDLRLKPRYLQKKIRKNMDAVQDIVERVIKEYR